MGVVKMDGRDGPDIESLEEMEPASHEHEI